MTAYKALEVGIGVVPDALEDENLSQVLWRAHIQGCSAAQLSGQVRPQGECFKPGAM